MAAAREAGYTVAVYDGSFVGGPDDFERALNDFAPDTALFMSLITLTLTASLASDTRSIDWAALKENARPDRVDPATWDIIWANMEAQVGSTWGDYIAMLNDNAAYLGRLGKEVRDASQLFGFELQQANSALHPLGQLAGARDTTLPAPGLSLSFSRVFPNSITGRNRMGPLGRGWYHFWQASLEAQPDGTLFITGADGSQRRFQPDRRGAWGPGKPTIRSTVTRPR